MKTKKSFFSSVKTKLIVSMICLAGIPLILATTISYFSSTAKIKSLTTDNLGWDVWYLQANIHSLFAETKAALTSLAASDSTQEFLKTGAKETEVLAQMKAINDVFDDGNQITLSNMEGMMVLRSDDSYLVDISLR